MKIENSIFQAGSQNPQTAKIDQVQPEDKNAQGSVPAKKSTEERDNFNISKLAEKLNQALSSNVDEDKLRSDKLAAVKDRLVVNSYQVDSKDVAEKMGSFLKNGL